MPRKQLLALFACQFVFMTVSTLNPLLPVNAVRLGAGPAAVGYYLASAFVALAAGALTAGPLSDRLQRRKAPLVATGFLCVPLLWLLGRATDLRWVVLLTDALYFCGALQLALISILAGLSAGAHERGRVFGILGLTSGVTGLIGGLANGVIADRFGYPALFTVMALVAFLGPCAALFVTEMDPGRTRGQAQPAAEKPALGRSFRLLFSASLLAATGSSLILLGRALVMTGLGFSATAISSTGAVAGLVTLPLPFVVGWLSDRLGRRLFLVLAYAGAAVGLALLPGATTFLPFAVAAGLVSFMTGVNSSVGNALVTDLVPPAALGRALSRYGAAPWIAGVVGYAAGGLALQRVGPAPTFLLAMTLPLAAVGLLLAIRRK